jgi:hypothetical protein
MAEVNGDRTRA